MRKLALLGIFAAFVIAIFATGGAVDTTAERQQAADVAIAGLALPGLPGSSRQQAPMTRIADTYSYCGACTSDSACGSGNKCCTGDCSGDKKKCYQVDTCP